MVKETNGVLNGEYLMIMRGTFDRMVMERLSNHTHFIDKETEALRSSVMCPSAFSQMH